MTTLNNYARPEWAAPRKETWYEHLLPQRATDAINQSPLVGALSKYLNSPTPDLTLPSQRDSQVPMPRAPSWFDDKPIAAEAVDRAGFLANFLAPGVKLPPQAPKPQGIRAYHGSPHDFDKFDISKIGTGEGAQAYGRGLYFAEAEAVAKEYRDTLSNFFDYRGKLIPTNAEMAQRLGYDMGSLPAAHDFLISNKGNLDRSIRDAQKLLAAKRAKPNDRFLADVDARELEKAILEMSETRATLGTPWLDKSKGGRMYEVKINADPETFLDWDKPLRQQNPAVSQAIDRAIGDKANDPLFRRMFLDQGKAQEAYGAVVNVTGSPEKARTALRDAGIPGIRYKDAMSRNADGGTNNYAVFDDKLIEILRKYGLLPPVAAGAASLAQQQEPPL